MGTAYLMCDEAVETGAVSETYRSVIANAKADKMATVARYRQPIMVNMGEKAKSFGFARLQHLVFRSRFRERKHLASGIAPHPKSRRALLGKSS